jgi:hypothetical protein
VWDLLCSPRASSVSTPVPLYSPLKNRPKGADNFNTYNMNQNRIIAPPLHSFQNSLASRQMIRRIRRMNHNVGLLRLGGENRSIFERTENGAHAERLYQFILLLCTHQSRVVVTLCGWIGEKMRERRATDVARSTAGGSTPSDMHRFRRLVISLPV